MSESLSRHSARSSASWQRWRMGELDTSSPRPSDSDGKEDSDGVFEPSLQQRANAQRAEFEALCQQTLAAARTEGYQEGFESGREAGYSEGLAQGRLAGEQELQAQARVALAPIAELLQTFHEALQQLDDSVADELVELAMETGRQLAGEALKSRPTQVLNLVRKLLHKEPLLSGQPRLWLNPADHKLVARELGTEFEAAGWALQPDDQISRGDCRVTSISGELDATQDSRWRMLLGQIRRPRRRQTAAEGIAK